MLERLVGNLRLRYEVAITLAELRFLRVRDRCLALCGMRKADPPASPSPSKPGAPAPKQTRKRKRRR